MKTTHWQSVLTHDALSPLLSSQNRAVAFFAAKDLAGEGNQDPKTLWGLPEAQKIVSRQQPDGLWVYPGGGIKATRSLENYNQIETFRQLGYLVEMYGFDKRSPAIKKAAAFLLSFQTEAGDIRGILGNQYTPYYTAGMMELLIKAGYAEDRRITRAFAWLESMRQDDGGWAIPLRTCGRKLDVIAMKMAPIEPNRSKPFSHMVTGVVLRAYAAHPKYRSSKVAKEASALLLANLFKKDNYPDRQSPDYWLRFTYPFWFTDLISATDSLSKLDYAIREPQIKKAAQWFVDNQNKSGLWQLKTLKNKQYFGTELWLSLAICRILQRLYR